MSHSRDRPVVLCMKWGTLYCADYVNVLYNAVRSNLSVEHRFVCLTDNADGLLSDIETYPIPNLGLDEKFFGPGAWPKLCVFMEDLYGLTGRCLFIDLDSVICGDLTPLFEEPGGIVVIREWRRFVDYFRKWQVNGATGVFAFTFGSQSQIFEAFMEDPEAAYAGYANEQRFVTYHARDMRFWDHPTIISFKRHLLAAPLVNRFVPPGEPWDGVKVVAFHGKPRPIDVVPDRGQKWGKVTRYGRGAVPFVRTYWLKHGGAEPL